MQAMYIPNSCYYIMNNNKEKNIHQADMYDCDGNKLSEIPLEPPEYYHSSSIRLDELLDKNCVGKARPAIIKIGNHIKIGRTIFFVDKNGNTIRYQRYRGPLDLGGLCKHQRESDFGYRMDYDWIMENKITVEDNYGYGMCSIV